jgi:hypothetical protein
MGYNYSFHLIVESKQVDLLLQQLALYLSENDARRLMDSLPWVPETIRDVIWGSGSTIMECQGIGGLHLGEYERENHYCFSFLFPPDADLEEYERREHIPLREGDKIHIGCIYTRLYVSDEYALLKATAAATDMSLLFSSSPSIRKVMIELAAGCSSIALFIDSEKQYDWLLLYPEVRTTANPNPDLFYSPDYKILRTDAYCLEALHLAHLF